jgi:hypothetical protein
MRMVAAQGDAAITKEEERVRKLLRGQKISGENRVELTKTLNVLKSFGGGGEKSKKDEL